MQLAPSSVWASNNARPFNKPWEQAGRGHSLWAKVAIKKTLFAEAKLIAPLLSEDKHAGKIQ